METAIPIIRPVRAGDVAAVLALVRTTLAEFGLGLGEGADSDALLANLPGSYADAGGAFFVAELGGALVGTAGLARLGNSDFELQKMFLSPATRGKGVGRKLLTACLDVARAAGARRVVLDTNSRMTDAIAFYEKSGFVRDDSVCHAGRCDRGYRLDLP
jgi:putative acetyltransferase